jgi:hypothetical protein
MVFGYYSGTDFMLRKITNQLWRNFVVTVMKVSLWFEWLTSTSLAERTVAPEVSHVTSRYVLLHIEFGRDIPGYKSWLHSLLWYKHKCYLPEPPISLPHLRIQFTNFHLITYPPSLSMSSTWLLFILLILIQNRHYVNDTAFSGA